MATKAETLFRKKVRKNLMALRANGFPLWFEPIQQRAIRGSFDFVVCANGHFIGLELKSEEGKLSELQEVKRDGVLAANGLALVASPSNWDTVLKTILWYLTGGNDDDCPSNHEVA